MVEGVLRNPRTLIPLKINDSTKFIFFLNWERHNLGGTGQEHLGTCLGAYYLYQRPSVFRSPIT